MTPPASALAESAPSILAHGDSGSDQAYSVAADPSLHQKPKLELVVDDQTPVNPYDALLQGLSDDPNIRPFQYSFRIADLRMQLTTPESHGAIRSTLQAERDAALGHLMIQVLQS